MSLDPVWVTHKVEFVTHSYTWLVSKCFIYVVVIGGFINRYFVYGTYFIYSTLGTHLYLHFL